MKVGDRVGIGAKGYPATLDVIVRSIDAEGITFYVVNGAWYGSLTKDGTMTAYFGTNFRNVASTAANMAVLVNMGDTSFDSYDEALDVMNKNWLSRKLYLFGRKFENVGGRFIEACAAFMMVMRGEVTLDQIHNDTIPF